MSELSSEVRFLHVVELGLGAWQWGDRLVWQFGNGYGDEDVRKAFLASLQEGIRFVDTAEVYGGGRSERLLGRFIKETDQPVLVATKFFPYPWRFSSKTMLRALRTSLERLGIESLDLYQIHWPSLTMSTDRLMEGLAQCVKSGLARTAGVSNYDHNRMLAAYSALARHGTPLASNQVHYSLLNRGAEKKGLLVRCQELGIRMIAYSPLEKGLLTGKYDVDNPPPGTRARRYASLLPKLPPLIKLLTQIGQDHGGKSNAQVSLNWVICKGAMAIPGAKTEAQALENAGALGWKLTDEEVARLDQVSDQVIRE